MNHRHACTARHSSRTPVPRPHALALAGVLTLALAWAGTARAWDSAVPTPVTPASALPAEDLQLFARTVQQIAQHHVDAKSGHDLVIEALRRLLASLDRHSALIETGPANTVRDAVAGRFGGIGVELDPGPLGPVVVQLFRDAPAQRAGLRVGDRITEVEGEPTAGSPLDAVIARIKGPPRSTVRLQILREGDAAPRGVTVERQLVRISTVSVEAAAPTPLVRITQFMDGTPAELLEQLAETDARQPLQGLVLDLRGNPGGVVEAGVEVASVFLPPNRLVLSSHGRSAGALHPYLSIDAFTLLPAPAVRGLVQRLRELPLVVLVDRLSASAAEFVAAALQDHGRARVVGCGKTYGKGSIQSIVPMGSGYAIKFTTARFSAPGGRPLEGQGVTPDLLLPLPAPSAVAPVPAEATPEANPRAAEARGGDSQETSARAACDAQTEALLALARQELARQARTASRPAIPGTRSGS
jgi:carboxyl-terminal processing protease